MGIDLWTFDDQNIFNYKNYGDQIRFQLPCI
jgi:hypothetical protein